MHYRSSRGDATTLDFAETVLSGLARDGGLFLPERYPTLTPSAIAALAGRPFADVATEVIAPYVGECFSHAELGAMTTAAYAGFGHAAVAPLVQIDDGLFVLELFHGPTLAFKDVAMQLLGRMMDALLARSVQRATIVGATSGDTGAAAIEAFRGLDQVDVFILYPHGRVSDVQRRQMTTVRADNVHPIAIEGTFDDCQRIVKSLFGDLPFRDAMRLSGVNSINWARIVAQVTYYFTAAVALGGPYRPVSFAVPTGNFGDVLAGWVAKRMGLPIGRLGIATNLNDILVRTFATGRYEVTDVTPTQSPSMDIQVSSNFERLLFEAHGRDAGRIRGLMAGLAQSGAFTIAAEPLAAIRAEFDAIRLDEATVTAEMARTFAETGIVLDPHTAIAVGAGRQMAARDRSVPVVALGTAHPAKFPDAVVSAIGRRPELPAHLADLLDRPERFTVLPDDVRTVAGFMRDRARVGAMAS